MNKATVEGEKVRLFKAEPFRMKVIA